MDVAGRQPVDEQDEARDGEEGAQDVEADVQRGPFTAAVGRGGGRAGEVVREEQGEGGDFEGAFYEEADPEYLQRCFVRFVGYREEKQC